MSSMDSDAFVKALFLVLDEAFDQAHGIFLDGGTSLFETLAQVSAEEASIPVGGKCATLAAQVKHTAFYLDVTVESVTNPQAPPADWGYIWQTVSAVSQSEWVVIQLELRDSYNRIKQLMKEYPAWTSEAEIGGAIGVIAHTAYHLGEIRQALCTLKP